MVLITDQLNPLLSFFYFQDRATFHRLIVRNNAKKRRTYEAFIECVPLLKSLEVRIRNTNSVQIKIIITGGYLVTSLCLVFVVSSCLSSSQRG